MRVGFIDITPDGRRWKILTALKTLGIETSQVIFPCRQGERDIESQYVFNDPIRLWKSIMRSRFARLYYLQIGSLYRLLTRYAVDKLNGMDVLHCQSSPDFIAANAVGFSSKPVAAEIYDVMSLYDDPVFWYRGSSYVKSLLAERALKWERIACTKTHLVVFTTQQMRNHKEEVYGQISRTIVVPNAVNQIHINIAQKARERGKLSDDSKRHGVYLGALESSKKLGGHRMIVPQLKTIASQLNCNIDIYGTSMDMASVIAELGDSKVFRIKPLMHYDALFEILPTYDFGISVLAPKNERLLNAALPNKLFEYAAAGLPSIVSPYEPLAEFVKTFNAGAVWHLGDDVPDIGGKVPFNDYFSMEFHVNKLVDEYKKII